MANADIGEIKCALCGFNDALVRKINSDKPTLYYFCPHCGLIRPPYAKGQEYILKNARMYPPGGKPEAVRAVVVDLPGPPGPKYSAIVAPPAPKATEISPVPEKPKAEPVAKPGAKEKPAPPKSAAPVPPPPKKKFFEDL